MQVARLLEPRAERSFRQSCARSVRAVEIERVLTKDEVLALYLDLAPYGGNHRRHPRRLARLFRQGAAPAVARRGGAARRLAAIAGSAPAGSLGRSRAQRAQPRARPLCRSRQRAGRRDRARQGRAGADRRGTPMPMLAPHAADRGGRATPRREASIRLTIDADAAEKSRRAGARARRTLARRSAPISRSPSLAVDNATGEVLGARRLARLFRRAPRRPGGHDAGAALAGLDAQAVHLRPRLRGRLHPSRDADRGSAGALRHLCAGEFRFHLPGHGHGAQGAAVLAQRAGGRRARPRRRQPACRAADASRRRARAARRARRRVSRWALAASASGSPIW